MVLLLCFLVLIICFVQIFRIEFIKLDRDSYAELKLPKGCWRIMYVFKKEKDADEYFQTLKFTRKKRVK